MHLVAIFHFSLTNPIAKIEFTVLPKSVKRAYAGQHGYETEIWPVATRLYANLNDPDVKKMIGSDADELAISFGSRVAELSSQFRFYRYTVWLQLALVLGGFAILFWLYGQLSFVISLSLGVVANVLTQLLFIAYSHIRHH